MKNAKKKKKGKLWACRGKKGGCLLISHEEMITRNKVYAKAA